MFDVDLRSVATELLSRSPRKKQLTRNQLGQLCIRHGVKLSGNAKGDPDFDLEEIKRFACHRLLSEGLTKAHELVDRGRYDDAVNAVVSRQAQFPRGDASAFHEIFSSTLKIPVRMNLVPTGIEDLDEELGGGIAAGEVFTVMAETSGGKSTFLIHLAVIAAGSGKSVAFYTLGDSPAYLVELRMRSTAMGEKNPNERKWKKFSKRGKFKPLYLAGFAPGVLRVDSINRQLPDDVDFIIVDYADQLLSSSGNQGDGYFAMGEIFNGLKRIAIERNIPVATASQIQRTAYDVKQPQTQHMAVSIQKAEKSDIIISISEQGKVETTKKGKKREGSNLTLCVAKNREGPRFGTAEVTVEWSICRFEKGHFAV
jgi:replicative DNA helicase